MADYTVVVRAAYRSNVAAGVRQDAGAIANLGASLEQTASKSISTTARLAAFSGLAGKALAIGIGGSLAVGVKAAMDFESAMAEVAKTTDMAGNSFDRNSGPLAGFADGIRLLSLRTPVDASDLAELAGMGGQLGIEVPNLLKFTEVVAALGVTTNMSAMEAAKGMARFANIMRTPQDEFDRLGNVIVELGNNLATTESEILRFATRIAPVGRVVRMTEEGVFGLSAALTSLGVPAERGGTALQKWFILAKTAVDSGSEALTGFSRVAQMSRDEFSQLFNETPERAFQAFVAGLDAITVSGGNVFNVLQDLRLSEVRATQVLLAAAGGVEVLGNALDLAETEGQEMNAMWAEAARRYGTTTSQVKLLANSFNNLKIEIGNAALATGFVHGLIEVFREFLATVKDNVGVVGALVKWFTVLIGLRMITWVGGLVGQLAKTVTQFQAAAAGAQKLTMMMKGAQVASAALGVAMGVALGVAGLLAIHWANAAIKAAELRSAYQQLVAAMDDGATTAEAFESQLRSELSDRQKRVLAEYGISVKELSKALIEGGDTLDKVREKYRMFTSLPGWDLSEHLTFAKTLTEAEDLAEGFRKLQALDFRDALIETGHAAYMTETQIADLVKRGQDLLGLGAGSDEFANWINSVQRSTDGWANSLLPSLKRSKEMRNEIELFGTAWQDMVAGENAEERGKNLRDFYESTFTSTEQFLDQMADAFEEVGEKIGAGFPVWDEAYEKMALSPETYRKILNSQQLFLEDTADFINRLPSMLDMGASIDTVGWVESLDAPIRGAISRLNDIQLQELIDGANRNFDRLSELHLQRWMQVYPGNAKLAFDAMVVELSNTVQEMHSVGWAQQQAWATGIRDRMAALPTEHRTEFLGYLEGLLSDPAFMAAMGWELGDEWVEGLLKALRTMAGRANNVIRTQSQMIQTNVKDLWAVESPSRWWENLGEMFVAGFNKGIGGLNQSLESFGPKLLAPVLAATSGSMSTVTNNRSSSINLTINSGASNVKGEAQTLLTLLNIVGGVEGGAGR